MKRTTLAIVLATGALAVPAVALASGEDDAAPTSTTPVQQQQEQQPRDQQRPDHDCPEGQDRGGNGGESSQTLL